MFQIPSLALNPRVCVCGWGGGGEGGGDCGAARSSRAAHSPLPTHSQKKKKTHLLTLLLQNHLVHLNILLLDLWHIHDLLSRVVTKANMCTSTRAVACRLYERCR